jgi:hypothetical protein
LLLWSCALQGHECAHPAISAGCGTAYQAGRSQLYVLFTNKA